MPLRASIEKDVSGSGTVAKVRQFGNRRQINSRMGKDESYKRAQSLSSAHFRPGPRATKGVAVEGENHRRRVRDDDRSRGRGMRGTTDGMSASVVRDVEPLTVRTTLSCSSGLEKIKKGARKDQD